MRALLDALGIDRVHLVGHDIGAGIAQIFAVRHRGRLFDLTLMNPVGYDYWPVQPITALRTPFFRQLAMASLDLGVFRLIIQRGLVHKDRLTPELLDLFWQPLRTPGGRKAFLRFARSLDNRFLMDIAPQFSTVDLPVLVVRGDGDVYLSPEICSRLARDFPRASLLRIPDGGHFVQEDAPEVLAQAMVEFFSRGTLHTARP